MSSPRLKVGDTLRVARSSFEEHRPLIIRMTVIFAALVAISSLLDLTGAAGLAVSFGISILLGAVYGGMITALICLPAKSNDPSELWAAVRPVLARLIWVTLIVAISVGVGIAFLIVPGLIIVTLWSVSGQVVVVEKATVFGALGRSFNLVKSTAWQVFLYLVVIALISLLMVGLALLVAFPLGTGSVAQLVGNFLINLLSTPVVAIGSAALFLQLSELEKPAEPEETDPYAL